jgi:hypothetical protein
MGTGHLAGESWFIIFFAKSLWNLPKLTAPCPPNLSLCLSIYLSIWKEGGKEREGRRETEREREREREIAICDCDAGHCEDLLKCCAIKLHFPSVEKNVFNLEKHWVLLYIWMSTILCFVFYAKRKF